MSRLLRLNLAMLMAGLSSFSLLYCPQPLLPLLAAEFSVSAAESSLAVALTSAPMALAILAGGILSDRIQRRTLMTASLFAAAALTVATAIAPDWHVLLTLRVLTGVALAGVPAVAMAHIASETDPVSIGGAMGVYVAGTGLGGIVGRLMASYAADFLDWRWAFALTGFGCLGLAVAFILLLPAGQVAQRVVRADARQILGEFAALLRDRVLVLLYFQAFLFMGVFLTILNFMGFHLAKPPFSMSSSAIGSIVLLFLVGSAASTGLGWLSGRVGRSKVFMLSLTVLLAGLVLTLSLSSPVFVIGLLLVIVGFFGAHVVASSWVGLRATAQAGKAAALYLFFYHLGSAVVSSVGGLVWQGGGWGLIVAYTGALCGVALLSTLAFGDDGGPSGKSALPNLQGSVSRAAD